MEESGKFFKGKSKKPKSDKVPKGLKKNTKKKPADTTVQHDTDGDRTQWTRGDGHGLPQDFGGSE